MTDEKPKSPLEEIFGNVIYSYTRRQAIDDGVLVDLMQSPTPENPDIDDLTAIVREAGFKVPVAMTATAWAKAVCPANGELPVGQDMIGRLWDVLSVLRAAIAMSSNNGPELRFAVHVWDGQCRNFVELKCVSGPGDEGEHVLTIMLPEED